jgi:hypothetical protein
MNRKLLNLRLAILVLVTGIAFSGCSKDSTKTADIVGTWTAGTFNYTAMVGSMTLTQYYMEVMGATAEEAALYASIVEQTVQQFFTGTITVKSDHTFTDNFGGTTETGTWSLNSDETQLTITPSTGDPMTFEVVELTSSKLVLHVSETQSVDLNGDEVDESLIIDGQLTFNK